MTAKKTETTDNPRKRKRIVPTRVAGTPAFENPADELFAAAFANRKELGATPKDVNNVPVNTTTGTTTGTTTTTETGTTILQPTSPERDFTKTPNSIVRVALAQGLFRGKSKQIYDYLWSVSRGAINPSRKIRRTFGQIQKGAAIGSRNTILAGLVQLETVGLIIREVNVGESSGNTYEIFTPEELGLDQKNDLRNVTTGTTTTTTAAATTREYQNQVIPILPISTTTTTIQNVENKGTYGIDKTSFKDISKTDDEVFAALNRILREMSEKATGKPTTTSEANNWRNLAELLKMEFELAAARTESISNVPAFLTEHLRRRLLRKPETRQIDKNSGKNSSRSLQVGKPIELEEAEIQDYQAEPLTDDAREVVLKTINEYIEKGQKDFVLSFRHIYTEEDWKWLNERLSKPLDTMQERVK